MQTTGFREMYHGTSAQRVNSIRKNGLFPQKPPRYQGHHPMLTTCREEAENYARGKWGDPVAITYWVPESLVDYFLSADRMDPFMWYTPLKPLPGCMIHYVDVLEASAPSPTS